MSGHEYGGGDDQKKKDHKSEFAQRLAKLYQVDESDKNNTNGQSTRQRSDSTFKKQAADAAAKLSKQLETGRKRAASVASSVTSSASTRLQSLRDFIIDKIEDAKSVVAARLPLKEHETEMKTINILINTVLKDFISCIQEYHTRLQQYAADIEDKQMTTNIPRLSLTSPEQLLEISKNIVGISEIKSPLTHDEEAKFYAFCDLVYERMINVNIPINQNNINAVLSVYMPEFLMLVSSIIQARLPLVEEPKIIPPIMMQLPPMPLLQEKRESSSSSSEEYEADSGTPRPPPPPIPQPNINKRPPIPPRPKGKSTNT